VYEGLIHVRVVCVRVSDVGTCMLHDDLRMV